VLEEELRITRAAKSTLEADLADAKKLQERTEQSVKEAESRSCNTLRLLETERDDVRVLKRRLVETEKKMSDMEQSAAGAETRVWARLRDVIYDQFTGARGVWCAACGNLFICFRTLHWSFKTGVVIPLSPSRPPL
jgi:hypothetical protein